MIFINMMNILENYHKQYYATQTTLCESWKILLLNPEEDNMAIGHLMVYI